MKLLKWVDIPPVWLIVFAWQAWIQASRFPVVGLGRWGDLAGGLCVGAGLVLMLLAVTEMRKAETTVIPHMTPQALVQDGIFRRSRNPIYLGDALILVGLILRWDAWPSLLLVPLFVWVITDRFIKPEEARMEAEFGPTYDQYRGKTRRWI